MDKVFSKGYKPLQGDSFVLTAKFSGVTHLMYIPLKGGRLG